MNQSFCINSVVFLFMMLLAISGRAQDAPPDSPPNNAAVPGPILGSADNSESAPALAPAPAPAPASAPASAPAPAPASAPPPLPATTPAPPPVPPAQPAAPPPVPPQTPAVAAPSPTIAATATPQVTSLPAGGYYKHVLGARGFLGAAGLIMSDEMEADLISSDAEFRFAGGGEIFYNIRFVKGAAFNLGVGLMGKGAKTSQTVAGTTVKYYMETTHVEFPLGFRFFMGDVVRLGLDLFLSIEVAGKNVFEIDKKENASDYDDTWWESFRRFNLGPRVTLDFVVPINRVGLMFGFLWEMDGMNYFHIKDAADDMVDFQARYMNMMGRIGMEFSL